MARYVGPGQPVRRGDVAEVQVRKGAGEGFGQRAGLGVEEGRGLREAVEHEDAEGWGGGVGGRRGGHGGEGPTGCGKPGGEAMSGVGFEEAASHMVIVFFSLSFFLSFFLC